MKTSPLGPLRLSIVGLGLLTVLGLAVALVSRQGTASPQAPPSAGPRGDGPLVVCLGHMDSEHGVAALAAMQPGRVVEVLVRDNDDVAAGAALIRLEDRQARLRVEEARADLSASREALLQAELLPGQHRKKVEQQLAVVAAARHEREAAQAELALHERLHRKDLLSAEDLRVSQARALRLDEVVAGEQARLEELRLLDPASGVRRARAEADACSARYQQAEQALNECTLKAPRAGRVLRILVDPGDVLEGPTRTALLFCPRGPRFIRAEVEQEFAGRVRVGQAALVEDASAPGPGWQGRVVRVSDWYAQRRAVLGEPGSPHDIRTVECLIRLDEGPLPLRIGQRVQVSLYPPASARD